MFYRSTFALALSALLIAGCGKGDGKKPGEARAAAASTDPAAKASPQPAPAASPATAEEPELDPHSIAWTQHTVKDVGVSVPVIDGVQVDANTMNTSRYVQQHHKPVRASFWLGKGRTVESWRAKYEGKSVAKLGKPENIEVCGARAVRQTLALRGGRMQVGFAASEKLATEPTTDKGETPPPKKPVWKTTPATHTTVVGFERKGIPVIASWTVEADKRDAFRVAEDAYFAGIACD